jgi:hypothetical protein
LALAIKFLLTTMADWFTSEGLLKHYKIPTEELPFLREKIESFMQVKKSERGGFVHNVWEEVWTRCFQNLSHEDAEAPRKVCTCGKIHYID